MFIRQYWRGTGHTFQTGSRVKITSRHARRFGAAQRGSEEVRAGARCAVTSTKFNQLFLIFKFTVCCFGAG